MNSAQWRAMVADTPTPPGLDLVGCILCWKPAPADMEVFDGMAMCDECAAREFPPDTDTPSLFEEVAT